MSSGSVSSSAALRNRLATMSSSLTTRSFPPRPPPPAPLRLAALVGGSLIAAVVAGGLRSIAFGLQIAGTLLAAGRCRRRRLRRSRRRPPSPDSSPSPSAVPRASRSFATRSCSFFSVLSKSPSESSRLFSPACRRSSEVCAPPPGPSVEALPASPSFPDFESESPSNRWRRPIFAGLARLTGQTRLDEGREMIRRAFPACRSCHPACQAFRCCRQAYPWLPPGIPLLPPGMPPLPPPGYCRHRACRRRPTGWACRRRSRPPLLPEDAHPARIAAATAREIRIGVRMRISCRNQWVPAGIPSVPEKKAAQLGRHAIACGGLHPRDEWQRNYCPNDGGSSSDICADATR